PGVRGVARTAPAPNVSWPPPPSPSTPRPGRRGAPAAALLPPDVAERVAQLKLADVIDIALRNNAATGAAWADARAAAASYGAAQGQYYPTLTLDGNVTAVKTVPSAGRLATKQQFLNPTLNLSWLLFDFGGRSGSVGVAREATEGRLQTTRGALALSMGLPANVPYDLAVPSDTTVPPGISDSVDALIERAVRERPDLAAERALVAAARARVSVARSQALP